MTCFRIFGLFLVFLIGGRGIASEFVFPTLKLTKRINPIIKKMKAVVTSGSRTHICELPLDYDNLMKFVSIHFPHKSEKTLSYKDKQGNDITISSHEDVDALKTIYEGQNFVEVSLKGQRDFYEWKGYHHGRHGCRAYGHYGQRERLS